MNSMLDIIGAFLAGSLLLISLIGTNTHLVESTYKNSLMITAQENAGEISKLVEYDLRKIGYGNDSLKVYITTADSNRITFISDHDNNGTRDSISYFTGDTTEVTETPNPHDRRLYRVVNTKSPQIISVGLTRLHFSYYDSTGNVTSIRKNIKSVSFELEMESTIPFQNTFFGAYIKKDIVAKNLLK